MSQDISTINRHLSSNDKQVRLKALKLLLQHPDATPIQLVQCLCYEDNRNFEFLKVFELDSAMRSSWRRLRGVMDEEFYNYLSSLYSDNPAGNLGVVVHVLELLCTRRSLKVLEQLHSMVSADSIPLIENATNRISLKLCSDEI